MDTNPIITRLRSATGAAFKLVGGAADFDAAADALAASPACFVIEQANSAGENSTCGVITQRVDVHLGVLLAVPMLRDSRGDADKSALEVARAAARGALLGWTPGTPGEHDPITYAGGQLLDFTPGLLWWQDSYRTTHTISSL